MPKLATSNMRLKNGQSAAADGHASRVDFDRVYGLAPEEYDTARERIKELQQSAWEVVLAAKEILESVEPDQTQAPLRTVSFFKRSMQRSARHTEDKPKSALWSAALIFTAGEISNPLKMIEGNAFEEKERVAPFSDRLSALRERLVQESNRLLPDEKEYEAFLDAIRKTASYISEPAHKCDTQGDVKDALNQHMLKAVDKVQQHIALSDKNSPGREVAIHAKDTEAFAVEEIAEKRLFLEALTELFREQGYDIDAKKLFKELAHQPYKLFGSQTLLAFRDFLLIQNHQRHENTESSTPYGFTFSFLNKKLPDGKKVTEPIYILDVKPWRTLAQNGVSKDMQKDWCRSFMNMDALSQHDYLHHLITHIYDSGHYFADNMYHPQFGLIEPMVPSTHTEEHALALHAQICRHLFKRHPERKAKVLEYAAKAFDQLTEMQTIAEAQCAPEVKKDVGMAITYLAELYSHRLLRVISPEDPNLRKPLATGHSVADAVNQLHIVAPWSPGVSDDYYDAAHLPAATPSFERLIVHSEAKLKDTLSRIHATDRVPLFTAVTSAAEMEKAKQENYPIRMHEDEATKRLHPMGYYCPEPTQTPLPVVLVRMAESLPAYHEGRLATEKPVARDHQVP